MLSQVPVRISRNAVTSTLPPPVYEDPRFENVALAIVKVTHRCNLDCAYCYEHIAAGADMDIALFTRLTSKLIRSSKQRSISIVLHGGEPSIMSRKWLSEAVNFIRTEARVFGKNVRVGMQSNMLALSEEKFRLIRDLDISLGVSMDGPGDIPDPMRPRADRATQKYRMGKSLGVKIGVLMTINHSNWNRYTKIMEWLHRDLKASSCKVNPITPVGMGIDLPWLTAEQIFRANKDIVDYMIDNGGEIVEDNMLREIRRFAGIDNDPNERTLCNRKHCGAGSEVIGITPGGDVLPCGRFGWDESHHYLGPVNDITGEIGVAEFNERVDKFHSLVPESWYDCDECPANNICSFGCQAFIVRSKKQANVDCLPTKMRFAYFQSRATELISLAKKLSAHDGPRARG